MRACGGQTINSAEFQGVFDAAVRTKSDQEHTPYEATEEGREPWVRGSLGTEGSKV